MTIDITELWTDSPEFAIAKRVLLDRYAQLRSRHAPSGPQTLKRELTPRERVASSYTVIIVQHADIATTAFESDHYAPGFALLRPAFEAAMKQFAIGAYAGEDDGWQSIPNSSALTSRNLKKLEEYAGISDLASLWKDIAPVLNDFVHGGKGQLTSNPLAAEHSKPQYPGTWFGSAMRLYMVLTLMTSGWLWAHLGYGDRCEAILRALSGEDWIAIETVHDGEKVRVELPGPSPLTVVG